MSKKLKASKEIPQGGIIIEPGSTRIHNTGSWRNQVSILDRKKCVNCFTCVNFCPEDCIKVKGEKLSHIDYFYCKGCGICARECPKRAIVMKRLD
jgi:pyruvate ferredoxin oxidoreductase delta subunit